MSFTDMTNDRLRSTFFENKVSKNLYFCADIQGTGEDRKVTLTCVNDEEHAFRLRGPALDEKYKIATFTTLKKMLATCPGRLNRKTRLIIPDERHDLDRLILFPETRDQLELALNKVMNRQAIEEVWGLSKIEPKTSKCVINFFGPPGTGKTMVAAALARRLDKPLLAASYSDIESNFVGSTAKNISALFAEMRAQEAVLFLDEADAIVSRRLQGGLAQAQHINQARNVFMQELDNHDGIVILTTNFFGNYDSALLRRIAQHVEFKLPNKDMRRKLFDLHIPNKDRLDPAINWSVICQASATLSGGDILNVVVNAVHKVSLSPDKSEWRLTERALLDEIRVVLETKDRFAKASQLKTKATKENKNTVLVTEVEDEDDEVPAEISEEVEVI